MRRTTESGLLVYGTNPVRELLRSGHRVQGLWIRSEGIAGSLAAAIDAAGVPVQRVSGAELDRMTGGQRHQGVVARADAFAYAGLHDVLAAPGRGAAVLDGVTDPRNLGAVIRSARAFGLRGVVLPKDRSAGITPVAVAASAGTVFGFAVARVANLVRALEALKESGMWVVGLDASAALAIDEVPHVEEPVVVLGSEGHGLRRLVRDRCDFVVRIPMAGGVESLNASVAAALAFQRLAATARDAV